MDIQCSYKYIGSAGKSCPFPALSEQATDGRYYCIFHAPEEMKDVESFSSPLLGKRSEIGSDFRGFVFPNGFSFPPQVPITETLDVSDAKFSGALILRDRRYNNSYISIDTNYSRELQLVNCGFGVGKAEDRTIFRGSHFGGKVLISSCKFDNGFEIRQALFKSDLWIHDCEFGGPADFTNLRVYGSVIISRCDFSKGVIFRGAHIDRKLSINNCEFGGDSSDLTSMRVGIAGENDNLHANFDKNLFESEVSFRGSIFNASASFTEAVFRRHAWFSGAKFLRRVGFRSATFANRAYFEHTTLGVADFRGTAFLMEALFSSLHPTDSGMVLSDLVYQGEVSVISNAEQSDSGKKHEIPVRLYRCILQGPLSIYGGFTSLDIFQSIFTGSVRALASKRTADATKPNAFSLSITRSEFHSAAVFIRPAIKQLIGCIVTGSMTLRYPNMEVAVLQDTDMRDINFYYAEWAVCDRSRSRFATSLQNRPCIYAESINIQETPTECSEQSDQMLHSHKEMANIYRELASNYESKRHYGLSGKFKVGEYDLRRSDPNTNLLDKAILGLYRAVSSYGESVLKPIIGMGVVVLIPAFFYLYNGLPSKEIANTAISYTDWNMALSWNWGLVCDFLIKAIPLSLTSCLPIRTELTNAISGCLHYLPTVQRLVFAVFSGSLIFAIRRKIKR